MAPQNATVGSRPITYGGNLDLIDGKPAKKPVTVINKSRVRIFGWAANVEKGVVPQLVYLEFEGPIKAYLKITTRRVERPDVVAYFQKPCLLNSGWEIFADLTGLPSGNYNVKIIQIEGQAALLYDTHCRILKENAHKI